MRRLLVALLVPLAVGCSIMDPGDRAELRHQIASMPPGNQRIMRAWYMNEMARKWLEEKSKKKPNDQMAKIQCRDNEGGIWSDWYDRPDDVYTVAKMWLCLTTKPDFPSYIDCFDDFEYFCGQGARNKLKDLLPAGTDVECKAVWDWRYDPSIVDPKIVDPNAASSPDDWIDAMIRLPAPPPGWAFPEFAPYLCPLGAGPGWGCPPKPTDPTGGQPADPTGGDHP